MTRATRDSAAARGAAGIASTSAAKMPSTARRRPPTAALVRIAPLFNRRSSAGDVVVGALVALAEFVDRVVAPCADEALPPRIAHAAPPVLERDRDGAAEAAALR